MARPKRGNGEGTHVKHKDGRHEYRIPDGTGKYRTASAKTNKEAIRKRDELRKQIESGVTSDSNQTVDHYLHKWLAWQINSRDLAPSTIQRYTEYIDLHIKPAIGSVPLKKLTGPRVQDMEDALLKKVSNRGRPLTHATVKNIHIMLRKALKDAYRSHLVISNVTDMFDPPKVKAKKTTPWTQEEARRFLATAHAQEDRLEALWLLALSTGLRSGEALALHWTDINFKTGECTIRQSQRSVTGKGAQLRKTKTDAGQRVLNLTPDTLAALKAHQTRQKAEKLAAGADWENADGRVFVRPNGRPLDGRSMPRLYLRPLMRAAEVPLIRFHDLRHTAGSLMAELGENPRAIADTLGHSNPSFTMTRYVHGSAVMRKHVAETMQAVLKNG